jgi:hypothetical protein
MVTPYQEKSLPSRNLFFVCHGFLVDFDIAENQDVTLLTLGGRKVCQEGETAQNENILYRL